MSSDAEVLLARARALLDSPDHAAVGNSARLAAFLARQAVEELIDARCASLCGVSIVSGTAKSKLAVLKSLDTAQSAAVLIHAWHQLSGFCHQHAYQLSPTVAEVRAQCVAVEKEWFGGSSAELSGDHVCRTDARSD